MRIFYVAQTTPNEIDLPDSKLWHINLYLPLVDLGHELTSFCHPWLSEGYKSDLKEPEERQRILGRRMEFGEALLRAVKKAHEAKPVDVFFSYFSSAHVEPEIIREIGRMGITTLNWYCNGSYQFYNVAEIAPAFHYCLAPEKFRLEDYRKVGAKPIYCQEGANPNFYRPYDVPLEFDITFVGQKYGNRPNYLRALMDAGLDARVWGPNWQSGSEQGPRWKKAARRLKRAVLGRKMPVELPLACCGPPLGDGELIQMYSRSRISLGFTTVAAAPAPGEEPVKQVRLRDFEATMSGAFYLVEYFEELTEFFIPDKEIVCFQTEEELVEKSRHYLGHPEERERIREAGMRRARSEHSWQRRFQTVFREIGLK
jgi:spore maturation protein CgeB